MDHLQELTEDGCFLCDSIDTRELLQLAQTLHLNPEDLIVRAKGLEMIVEIREVHG